MSKLTKREIQLHDQAVCLLQKEHLSHEDKLFTFRLKFSNKTLPPKPFFKFFTSIAF